MNDLTHEGFDSVSATTARRPGPSPLLRLLSLEAKVSKTLDFGELTNEKAIVFLANEVLPELDRVRAGMDKRGWR